MCVSHLPTFPRRVTRAPAQKIPREIRVTSLVYPRSASPKTNTNSQIPSSHQSSPLSAQHHKSLVSVKMSLYRTFYHVGQATASVYSGLLSAMAIYNLQKGEDRTEQAAQYSNLAANQLHKTRTTQTSGVLAVRVNSQIKSRSRKLTSWPMQTLSSLASAVYLAATQESDSRTTMLLLISTVNSLGLALAYNHLTNFWRGKAKVPLMTDYNDGVTASNRLRYFLAGLSASWGLIALVYLWDAISG